MPIGILPMRIYTGGTFDPVHAGHVKFFRDIKTLFPQSYLVVVLNQDDFIESYKGYKPKFSYEERKKLLLSVEYINGVIPNEGGADSTITILKVKPQLIVIGNDWLERDYCKQMGFTAKWLTEHQIALLYLPLLEGISNTEIKKRVKEC